MYPVYLFLFNEMSCLYLHAPLATSCPVGRSVLPHEQLQVRRSQIVRRWLHDQSTVIRTYSARVVDLCLVDLSWSLALSTDTPIPTIIIVRKVVLSSFLPINGWSTTGKELGSEFWGWELGTSTQWWLRVIVSACDRHVCSLGTERTVTCTPVYP